MSDPLIYLSFRFHGNFYHSYRGDTPDELGFGKDMRIIRHIIQSLDDLNQRGIPIKGTWDFENYFSLETIMPEHCPDIIAGLQRRVQEHGDEMHLMSYNNGLVSAHTAEEFREAIVRGISNLQGSGLRDLFGAGFFPMVRPQEMLFTPIHLKLYKALGIEAISLYYSAIPFNGFSNFVPLLSPAKRYNPLTLTYPGIDETMTLLPCYNHGDLIDHLTLRRWVRNLDDWPLATAVITPDSEFGDMHLIEIARGCTRFVACGGAGVLDRAIARGHLLVPTAAVRDEGTSYHYLPPSREVCASPEAVAAIETVLAEQGIAFLRTKTWTTDAFYRETPDRVARRREEGCLTVEMEAAAFLAVARFRGVALGQLLYSGDDVSGTVWDSREWHGRTSIRERLFWLAAEACAALE